MSTPLQIYRTEAIPDELLKNFFMILYNIANNPNESKFKKLRLGNVTIKALWDNPTIKAILLQFGEEMDGHIIINKNLKDIPKLMDEMIKRQGLLYQKVKDLPSQKLKQDIKERIWSTSAKYKQQLARSAVAGGDGGGLVLPADAGGDPQQDLSDLVVTRGSSLPQYSMEPKNPRIYIQAGANLIEFRTLLDSGNEGPIMITREFFDTIRQYFPVYQIELHDKIKSLVSRIYRLLGAAMPPNPTLKQVYEFFRTNEPRIQNILHIPGLIQFGMKDLYILIGCQYISGVTGNVTEPMTESVFLEFVVNDRHIIKQCFISDSDLSIDVLFNTDFFRELKKLGINISYDTANIDTAIRFQQNEKLFDKLLLQRQLTSKMTPAPAKELKSYQKRLGQLAMRLRLDDALLKTMPNPKASQQLKSGYYIDPYHTIVTYQLLSSSSGITLPLKTIFDMGNSAPTLITRKALEKLNWGGVGLPPPLTLSQNPNPLQKQIYQKTASLLGQSPHPNPTYSLMNDFFDHYRDSLIGKIGSQNFKRAKNLCGLDIGTVGVSGHVRKEEVPQLVDLQYSIQGVPGTFSLKAKIIEEGDSGFEVLINLATIQELSKQNIHLTFDKYSRDLSQIKTKKRDKISEAFFKLIDSIVNFAQSPTPDTIHAIQKFAESLSKIKEHKTQREKKLLQILSTARRAQGGDAVPTQQQKHIQQLIALGIPRQEAKQALQAAGGDLELTSAILLSKGYAVGGGGGMEQTKDGRF